MRIPRTAIHWTLLLWAWMVVGLVGLLMTVQLLLMLYGPAGTWHWPRIYRVTIRAIDTDPQSAFTTVTIDAPSPKAGPQEPPKAQEGKPGEEEQEAEEEALTIALPKTDRPGLTVGAELWVQDNYYRSPLRAPQFLLTPQRLLLEFPEPLLVLALLLIGYVRWTQARLDREERTTPKVRTVLRDDFHEKAQRFAAPKEPEP